MSELSDKNRPKKLEDIFREGMQEAEMAPSDLLWSRIERDLNIKDTGYYKQRLVWYQRLAAACVVLVVFAGAYLFFDARQDQQAPMANLPQATPASGLPSSSNPIADNNQPEHARKAVPQEGTTSKGAYADHLPEAPAAENRLRQARQLPQTAAMTAAANPAANLKPADKAFSENQETGRLTGIGPGNESSFDESSSMHAGQSTLAARTAPASVTSGPDSLAPAFNWPVLHSLAVLGDSMQPAKPLLAPEPAQLLAAAGEEEPLQEKKGGRWRFGGKYASQYFDQNIALTYKQAPPAVNALVPSSSLPFASAGAASYADALKEFDQETGSGFSFNTGLSAAYQVNDHLDLETGLAYTQNVATTNTSYIFNNAQLGSHYTNSRFTNNYGNWDKQALNNVSPVATGIPSTALLATLAGGATLNQTAVSKTQAFDTEYRYRMLGIPVKMNYQIKKRKSFYFASLGMLTNLLVQANILSDSDRVPDLQYNPKAKDSPFRNWHFAALAAAGKGFELSRGLQVKAGLEATQYLTPLTYHPEYLSGKQRKPYTIGLALSSSYTFGK